jgi:hypothetical protein
LFKANYFPCRPAYQNALSALPLGHNIVYSNILAQLAVPAVDLTKAETQCFILQAVQQVGQPGQNVERAGHGILTEEHFGLTILEQLDVGLGRIEKNWESFRALATFSLLARRVLCVPQMAFGTEAEDGNFDK